MPEELNEHLISNDLKIDPFYECPKCKSKVYFLVNGTCVGCLID